MASAHLKGAATLSYSPPGGSEIVHKLAVPLLIRQDWGYASTVRKRRWVWQGPDYTTRNIWTLGSAVADVSATIRFENEPAALRTLLRTALDDNVPVTYRRDGVTGDEYLLASVNGKSDAVTLLPDRARFALGEWETSLVLRRTSDVEVGLAPHEWWESGQRYFSDQAGTVPAVPLGTVQCHTGKMQGWKAVWDNAISGGSTQELNAAGNGIVMIAAELPSFNYRHQVAGVDTVLPLFAGINWPFTVVQRLKVGALTSPMHFFDLREIGVVGGQPLMSWGCEAGPQWCVHRSDDAGASTSQTSTTNPPVASTLYTVRFVFEGPTFRYYVNGALVMSGTLSVGQCSFNWLQIGGSTASGHNGEMYHTAIFDHANDDAGEYWESVLGEVP